MPAQQYLQRMRTIKTELQKELEKIKDLKSLKSEIGKLAGQINMKNMDINIRLSESNKKQLLKWEKKYYDLVRQLNHAQKRLDQEFIQFTRVLKKARGNAEKRFSQIQKIALKAKNKASKAKKKVKRTRKTQAG